MVASRNAPRPKKPGVLSSVSGANGRRPTASPLPGPSFFLGSPCSKKRTTPRTSIATTRVASPTGDNPSTFLGAFYSIISGPKDAEGTLMASTPSKGFCSNLGKLRQRWAWPPGRPLDLLARIGLRTIRIALSLPLRLNGFTAASLGRARLPFRGACCPPCTFSIFIMIDGAVASLPVRGSPSTCMVINRCKVQGPAPSCNRPVTAGWWLQRF